MLNVNRQITTFFIMKQKIIRIFILIIGVFLVISLSRSIIDLWQKGSAYDKEEQRFAKARLEHEQLAQQYETIQTPEYIEKQARDKLGLSKEGEIVVVLPQEAQKQKEEIEKQKESIELPIWKQWIEVIFN